LVKLGVVQWVPFTLLSEYISYYTDEDSIPPSDCDTSASLAISAPNNAGYNSIATLSGDIDDDETLTPSVISAGEARRRCKHIDAGMVLGIHNIYIVLPQFISTFVTSLIFSVLELLSGGATDAGGHGVRLGISENSWDAFGWCLRVGACASVFAAVLAWKVKEVHTLRSETVVETLA
jgi:solute carrier family 45 protein 1/2/4